MEFDSPNGIISDQSKGKTGPDTPGPSRPRRLEPTPLTRSEEMIHNAETAKARMYATSGYVENYANKDNALFNFWQQGGGGSMPQHPQHSA